MRRTQHFSGRAEQVFLRRTRFLYPQLIPNRLPGKYYSNAGSRAVCARRLPLCAHIPRSAAQRDQPSQASFHLFTLSIVIQMAAGFRQRGAGPALPPLSRSDTDTLASAAALPSCLLRCSACTLNTRARAHTQTRTNERTHDDRRASRGGWQAQKADRSHRQNWSGVSDGLKIRFRRRI